MSKTPKQQEALSAQYRQTRRTIDAILRENVNAPELLAAARRSYEGAVRQLHATLGEIEELQHAFAVEEPVWKTSEQFIANVRQRHHLDEPSAPGGAEPGTFQRIVQQVFSGVGAQTAMEQFTELERHDLEAGCREIDTLVTLQRREAAYRNAKADVDEARNGFVAILGQRPEAVPDPDGSYPVQ